MFQPERQYTKNPCNPGNFEVKGLLVRVES